MGRKTKVPIEKARAAFMHKHPTPEARREYFVAIAARRAHLMRLGRQFEKMLLREGITLPEQVPVDRN